MQSRQRGDRRLWKRGKFTKPREIGPRDEERRWARISFSLFWMDERLLMRINVSASRSFSFPDSFIWHRFIRYVSMSPATHPAAGSALEKMLSVKQVRFWTSRRLVSSARKADVGCFAFVPIIINRELWTQGQRMVSHENCLEKQNIMLQWGQESSQLVKKLEDHNMFSSLPKIKNGKTKQPLICTAAAQEWEMHGKI